VGDVDCELPRAGPTFSIRGPIARTDLPGLCDRVCEVLTAHAGQTLSCDVSTVPADAVTIEALALLQLAARRKGCRIALRDAAADLLGLVGFLGLSDVLPEEPVSRPAAPAD
jgi:ABC-type transporter Mla MlaB component